MIEESFFLGQPVPFKKGIVVYPPKVKEVVGNERFFLYTKMLCSSQEEIEDELMKSEKPLDTYPTPIEFLLNNSYHNKQYEFFAKEAFRFFIRDEVTFLYEQKIIIVGNLKKFLEEDKDISELVTIDENEFFDFQNLLRQSFGKKPATKPDPNEHPKIKEMKRKARYRDSIKAKQKDGITLFTTLVSICCMGLGINPLNIGEMSYVAIEAILNKYQDKEKYQLDIDTLMAGGDSKKIKPKYWISNFEN